MQEEKKKKTLQAKAAQSLENQNAPGQMKAAPAFSLSATSQMKQDESAPVQRATGDKDPAPMKVHKKEVEYGPRMEGPIAEKGAGDQHAFSKTDVNQGELGDCYMLSSLNALAMQSPELLEKAITGPKSDGTYDVTLYKKSGRGKKKTYTAQTINVSSSFIVNKVTGSLSYAQGGDTDAKGNEELWVKLIEKAYAKMAGSFDKVDGGWSEVALEILTGQEHTEHGFNARGKGRMSDPDLKQNIIDALAAGKPVTCSTYSDSKINKLDRKNDKFGAKNEIVGWHAYAVVSADENSIIVRNPWGEGAATPEPVLTWAQFRAYFSEYTTRD